MPIPIMPMSAPKGDAHVAVESPQYFPIDISQIRGIVRLPDQAPDLKVSNSDASLLFSFWKKSTTIVRNGVEAVEVPNEFTAGDVLRLKALGFISGDTDVVKFTDRGRDVIRDLALGEESQVDKNRIQKPYTEILADKKRMASGGPRLSVGKHP